MKFKVGDRVRLVCVEPEWVEGSINPIGECGTVDEQIAKSYGVRWDNGEHNSYGDKHLELAVLEPSPPAANVKVGDTIRILPLCGSDSPTRGVGTAHTVETVSEANPGSIYTEDNFFYSGGQYEVVPPVSKETSMGTSTSTSTLQVTPSQRQALRILFGGWTAARWSAWLLWQTVKFSPVLTGVAVALPQTRPAVLNFVAQMLQYMAK